MLWMKHHRIINVANSILNSTDLDQTVAHLIYAQGYAECTQHVTSALKVEWDASRSATYGVDTSIEHAAAKAEYNNLRLLVMDLVTTTLQSEDFVNQLKEIFLDEANASDKKDLE
ncbi:hypothetical protein Hanom_Chr04g00343941 [Helianthus anomalus]